MQFKRKEKVGCCLQEKKKNLRGYKVGDGGYGDRDGSGRSSGEKGGVNVTKMHCMKFSRHQKDFFKTKNVHLILKTRQKRYLH